MALHCWIIDGICIRRRTNIKSMATWHRGPKAQGHTGTVRAVKDTWLALARGTAIWRICVDKRAPQVSKDDGDIIAIQGYVGVWGTHKGVEKEKRIQPELNARHTQKSWKIKTKGEP